MECPRCGELRYKRSWKPSQWQGSSAYTDQFNCCRVCHPECLYVDYSELIDAWQVMVHCASHLCHGPLCATSWLEEFIVGWMELPRHDRKWLSYYGGIRRRLPTCPTGGTRVEGVLSPFADEEIPRDHHDPQVFDPGNWIYRLATRMLVPQLLETYHWNAETVGDIWESLLGYAALPQKMLHKVAIQRSSETEQWAKSFAQWIDAYVYSVYRFCLLNWNSVQYARTFDDLYDAVQQQYMQELRRPAAGPPPAPPAPPPLSSRA